jgi:hypothetical protein
MFRRLILVFAGRHANPGGTRTGTLPSSWNRSSQSRVCAWPQTLLTTIPCQSSMVTTRLRVFPFHLITLYTMQCPANCFERYESIRKRATRFDAGSHSLLFLPQQPMKRWMIGSLYNSYGCLVWIVIPGRRDTMLFGCGQQPL